MAHPLNDVQGGASFQPLVGCLASRHCPKSIPGASLAVVRQEISCEKVHLPSFIYFLYLNREVKHQKKQIEDFREAVVISGVKKKVSFGILGIIQTI